MLSFPLHAGSVVPIFPGGVVGLQRFIKKNRRPLSVPTEGTVFVEFVVDIDGSIKDLTVVERLSPQADYEALEILSSMPAWRPGTIDGKPAQFKFVLPIDF
ncbi:energy transducer TonB [Spirosoma sp. KUDC1026]|uniref:energy transducer TonB n=1 Tax=Spirosoma sp. KUDC1026 TaxID=2745947 RepID=UPI00159BA271|nr:energy transducer TonB [Spirosoma sp. KUDC1026]